MSTVFPPDPDPVQPDGRATLLQLVGALAVAISWLNPFSEGPSAAVVPWLVSLCAAAVLAACAGIARLPRGLWLTTVALAAWAVTRSSGSLDTYAFSGALALMLLAASVGAGIAARPDALRAIAWALLGAALASAAMALWQHQGMVQAGGTWISSAAPGEAYANLRQRNQFATLTTIGLCALAWLFAQGLRLRWALPMVLLLAVANAATTSRTGLLQVLLLALFAMGLPGPRRRERIVLCVVGLLAWAVAVVGLPALLAWRGLPGFGLFDRVAGVQACSSRRVLWSNVMYLVGQRPWIGWGLGELDYAHYATLYPGLRFCDILDNAHNLPLHLAVELGLPAAALVFAALAWAIWRLAPWRETDGARRLAWALLAAIGLHSLVEYPVWYGPFQLTAGLAVGLLAAKVRAAQPVRAPARLAWPALVLALAGYASWDYWRVGQIYQPQQARAAAYAEDTLARIADSRLYRDQVSFAALTTTPVSASNAARMLARAEALLHFSPEPRIVEKALDSALLLGRMDRVQWHLPRFRAAFPQEAQAWLAQHPEAAAAR